MESEGILFDGRISPLAFVKVDKPWSEVLQCPPDLPDILEMLCTPGLAHDPISLVNRWREISVECNRLCIVPNEQTFLERLVWPLRHAKAGYMLGNYLGTIALCGIVAEMLAILLYDISRISLGGKPISDKDEELLFGRKFEALGQERRVRVLRALGLIDETVSTLFDEVRKVRNRYLHLYSLSCDSSVSDAVVMFDKTTSLVVKGLGLGLSNTGFTMRPDFIAYLKNLGIARDVKAPGTPGEALPGDTENAE